MPINRQSGGGGGFYLGFLFLCPIAQGRFLTSQRTSRERALWFLRVRSPFSVVSQLNLTPTFTFQPSSCLFRVDPATSLATISYSISDLCPSLDPSISNGTPIHDIAPQYAQFQCLWRCDWQEQCNIVRDSVRCTDASSLASANLFPDLKMRSLFCVVLKMRPRAKC